ncbi:LOW QUALITY PROTEIN: centrosomal protein of 72 kDa [Theristicus caerulescens]
MLHELTEESREHKSLCKGIQHISSLEKVSLYYNHISYLSEVFRLQLTALQGLDLHLNHVKNSDYCLFIVFMLPSLRQLYPKLRLQDEAEAYDKITVQVNFTTHPATENCTMKQTNLLRSKNFIALQKNNEQPNALVSMPKQKLFVISLETVCEEQRTKLADSYFQEYHKAKSLAVNKYVYEATTMKHLLDIVDKHCSGSKSFHCDEKFLFKNFTYKYYSTLTALKQQLDQFLEQNTSLKSFKYGRKHRYLQLKVSLDHQNGESLESLPKQYLLP